MSTAGQARKTNRPAAVAALLLALFMGAMEMTVVSTAMPTVVAELGGALHYAWVFTAYMLTSTVTVPLYGKLADRHGRKPVMLAAMALFLIGSMASGQARTMSHLIVFRAVQGVGAGGMQPIALTVVGDIFEAEERAKMQGIFGAVWAIAGLVGPLLGGVIVATLSWRWVFYVNLPIGLASAALLIYSLVESVEPREHGLDVAGALLLTAAVVALLLGSDGTAPWILMPASFVLTLAFVAVESRAKDPILPLGLFGQRLLAMSSVLSALAGGSMIGLVTFMPLYAQGVLGATPTQAGGTIASMAVVWPVASTVSGRLLGRLGFRALVRAGYFVIAATAIWLALAIAGGASARTLTIIAAVFGFGMGLASTPLTIAVQTHVGFSQRGVATASTMFFRNIGGTVAVGAMGAVLAHELLAGVAGQGGGVGGPALVAKILGPERRSVEPAALAAIAGDLSLGLAHVMGMVAVLAVGAALAAWLFPAIALKPASVPPPG